MTHLILILILMIFSAIFSGAEIAFTSANELKLEKKQQEKPGRLSDLTLKIVREFDAGLVTILIGNNLVNIAASSAATIVAISLLGDLGAGAATLIMTVLIILVGEITPKILASRRPEAFARLMTYPIYILMVLVGPLVSFFRGCLNRISPVWENAVTDDAMTEDDLETIIETVEDEGIVDEDTADLLQSALDFDNVPAYQVITPRVDMAAIDIDDPVSENRRIIVNTRYSRLPVYRDTPDHIIGILPVNQCLKKLAMGEKLNIEGWMMEPVFVHKTMALPDVLELMRSTNNHMVIVTDEYGGTGGILTMEDVLEQIVGEIWDEKDVIDEEFVELDDDTFVADGDMRIDDLFYELDVDEKDFDDDNATLGGWAIEMLGGYPKVGDSFTYKNLQLTVKAVDNMRVTDLMVKVMDSENDNKEQENEND